MILPVLLFVQAQFQNPRLIESSGVAASRVHAGVLWTHNDSGDRPYLYATDLYGRNLGAFLVPGAEALDWEDMALGPCPRTTRAPRCVYLADTGDNAEFRPWVTVYAVPEPEPPTGPGDTLRTTAAPIVLRLRYPDGPHDVEAIFVSPRDSSLYLVSKRRGGVYRVAAEQWGHAAAVTPVIVQRLDIGLVTGAAIRPDGRLVAVRTYSRIYLFSPGVGGRLAPARAHACGIGGLEPGGGGEAIDFLDDSTFVLTNEGSRGRPGAIRSAVCRPGQ